MYVSIYVCVCECVCFCVCFRVKIITSLNDGNIYCIREEFLSKRQVYYTFPFPLICHAHSSFRYTFTSYQFNMHI